jgi:hypothetical protein
LRFELTPDMLSAAHADALIYAGIEHPAYPIKSFAVPDEVRQSLLADLDLSAMH